MSYPAPTCSLQTIIYLARPWRLCVMRFSLSALAGDAAFGFDFAVVHIDYLRGDVRPGEL